MSLKITIALILSWALPAQAMTIKLSHDDNEELTGVVANHKYLFAEGTILPGDAIKMKALLNRQFYNGKRTVILLTSKGGVLESVDELKRTILTEAKEYYEKYKESLVLMVNLKCWSACNILLAALTQEAEENHLEIHVANSAEFGFHSPVHVTRKKLVPIKDARELREKTDKMLKAYKSYGVSPAWIEANQQIFQHSKLSFIPAKKLCVEKSGIIPAESCYDDSGNRDIFADISKNIENKKPLFAKP